MELEEVRRELLEEHATLRALIRSAQELSFEILEAGDVRSLARSLRGTLRQLLDAVEVHTSKEDEALGPLLRAVGPTGAAQLELMEREHKAEHDALIRSLESLTSSSAPAELAHTTLVLGSELLTHMAEEEAQFLAPGCGAPGP